MACAFVPCGEKLEEHEKTYTSMKLRKKTERVRREKDNNVMSKIEEKKKSERNENIL